MAYIARFRERVRSFQLDIYAHVNNAVYLQWFEHGRSQMLQDKGFDYMSITDRWGVRLVTVATTLNWRAQLHLDDELEITSFVKRLGRTSVTYDQRVIRVAPGATGPAPADSPIAELVGKRGGAFELAADAETTICFTDPAMKGSVPIPPEFARLYG